MLRDITELSDRQSLHLCALAIYHGLSNVSKTHFRRPEIRISEIEYYERMSSHLNTSTDLAPAHFRGIFLGILSRKIFLLSWASWLMMAGCCSGVMM